MGVIRDYRNSSFSFDDAAVDDVLNNVSADDNRNNQRNAANEEASLALVEQLLDLDDRREERRRARRNNMKATPTRPEPSFRALGCRGMSHNKHRRYENSNLLAQTMAGSLSLSAEDLLQDIDIHDFIPKSMSAFATCLAEKEAMSAWNDFVTATEEDQQVFLDSVDDDDWVPLSPNSKKRRAKNSKVRQNSDGSYDETEARVLHPAFCPKAAFARLDKNLKSLLKRNRLPAGFLAAAEEEMSNFFAGAEPSAVYDLCVDCSYQRLALHVTCQWLDLICQSYDKAGTRRTKVTNRRDRFLKPSIDLASYVEKHRNPFRH
ncbi:R3H domain-containing protein 4 [Halotydeus destructor]|nr:R3H domain-containing protein 4 [Halotydeus destructor]